MKFVWRVFLFGGLILLTIAGYFAYYVFFGHNYKDIYLSGMVLQNPAQEMSDKEAVAAFDEDFIYYVLVGIKAYNLHAPPLSSDTPKIEFRTDDEVFNAEIVEGRITVRRGEVNNEDIVITAPKIEVVKMIRDRSYIQESFASGNSRIELVVFEGVLAAKGYLKIYNALTAQGN